MSTKVVEMMIEPGAEIILRNMGKQMRTKARSKVLNRALDHIRTHEHTSDVAAWFSEQRFMASRRTTVRISEQNAHYLETIAAMVGRGRPAILLDIVYMAASKMKCEDYEALR